MQVLLFSGGYCAAACHTMTRVMTEPDNRISEVTVPGNSDNFPFIRPRTFHFSPGHRASSAHAQMNSNGHGQVSARNMCFHHKTAFTVHVDANEHSGLSRPRPLSSA